MTEAMIDRLRELLRAATPGPWYFEPGDGLLRNRIGSEGHRRGVGDFAFITLHERVHPDMSDQAPAAADAALVVEAVNALPELLDAHDRMAGALTVERIAAALHEAQVCENWSPGYRHFGDDGEVHDDHGPAEHTEAARVLAALAVPKEENPDA